MPKFKALLVGLIVGLVAMQFSFIWINAFDSFISKIQAATYVKASLPLLLSNLPLLAVAGIIFFAINRKKINAGINTLLFCLGYLIPVIGFLILAFTATWFTWGKGYGNLYK